MKRSRDDLDDTHGHRKRSRANVTRTDRLSTLSHELTLRIFSLLTVSDLAVCHRLSRHFQELSGDSQLWKAHYYNRFVRPRASRLPGIRDGDEAEQLLHFSSKLSRWLDEDSLVKKGRQTNWKRQYKLRHNWSRGTCSVSEVAVSPEMSIPPLLVQMRESTIYMADASCGLRAWNSAAGTRMLANIAWGGSEDERPSALAVDTSTPFTSTTLVAVGFEDGSFSIYELDHRTRVFRICYKHPASSNGMLSAVALAFPYLATMTANQVLSVYNFSSHEIASSNGDHQYQSRSLEAPTLIHSLRSHSVWPPHTLSIRSSSSSVLISIAYALPTYLSGWTVGIQELHLEPQTSKLLSSRLASAIRTTATAQPLSVHSPPRTPAPGTLPTPSATEIHTPPTSLSYSHPYLLVSHPDNTLTLYLVTSTADLLQVSPGKRLWGHTSSVSGTSIGGRGRAVSVSRRGDEVRVWDLEGRVGGRVKAGAQEGSVRIVPEKTGGGGAGAGAGAGADGDGGDAGRDKRSVAEMIGRWSERWRKAVEEEDLTVARGWVGFDEENVVLLKERQGMGQSLVVYDFA